MKSAMLVIAMVLGLVGPVGLGVCGSGAALAQVSGFACCKVCKAGKACGDSCIAQTSTCKKGKGCACNG
ncbi:hypothetical protein [Blastomonas sp.]|uniref:hypothetical protein n=1 Tax=Blastomonas sp. TaxID=1909299 RepID=UPI00391BD48E